MKQKWLLLLVGSLLVLSSCQENAGTNDPSPAISDPVPTLTASPGVPNPSTEALPPDSLPWDVPPETTPPAYDEYFAERVDYGYETIGTSEPDLKVSSGYNIGNYRPLYQENTLYIAGGTGRPLWKVAEIPGLEVVLCDPDWLYGIVGGTDLIRVDYYGEKQETLFVDETGLISQLNDRFELADGKVMYFVAGVPEGGAAICRLYVPEAIVDVMYQYSQNELEQLYFSTYSGTKQQDPAYHIGEVYPISNFECTWSRQNHKYFELYASLLADEESYQKYFGKGDVDNMVEYAGEVQAQIARDYGVCPSIVSYYNAATGEYMELERTMYSGQGTWWKES